MNSADEHRNPDVDAAWRAASRDQPPPALDAAITAAARRAVGAGPKRLGAPRAWWPVAAAAVVAVVAIGIVEMTPPDEIVPTEIAPAAPQAPLPAAPQPPQDTRRDERAAAPAGASQPAPPRIEAPRKIERAAPPSRADAPATAGEGTRGTTAAEPAPRREPAAARAAPKPGVPFPASPSDASPAMNAAAPAPDGLSAMPPSPKARQQTPPSSAGASAPRAPAPFAEDKRQTTAGAAGALAARPETAPASEQPALAERTKDSETVTDEAQARTVDEWIRLIRRLKAEGRNDLAAKELAAFRARYQERAEALLPADLRATKP
jgi:hypothetical protein